MPSHPPFFFVRHGETDWNREGRLQGQRDIPLNGKGRHQAAAAARKLMRTLARRGLVAADLDYLASPLGRTVDTMRLLRSAARLAPPEGFRTDSRLKELSFGSWEGRTWGEIKDTDPDGYAGRRRDKWTFAPPGGESYAALRERVEPALGSIAENAVLVGHGGVARVLLNLIAGVASDRAPDIEIWQGRVLVFADNRAAWV